MGSIIIRKAEKHDAAPLLEFLKQVGGETNNLSFGSEGLPFSVEQQAEFIAGSDDRNIYLVAIANGVIIGDASLSILPRRMAHRAELGISVIKSYWGQGIGAQLVETLIEHAKTHNIEVISLEVRSDNHRAIHLYKKFGFRTIGTFEKFFKIGNEYSDFELMQLVLV